MFPDFNRLKIFSLVYENRSVSGAARTLKISQPAVSQQLKKLERELRVPLFTRANKRIIPTPAAKRLHEKIAPFIADLQDEITYLRRPLDTPYGQLTIGASPVFGSHMLPMICSHFRFRFPTVTFNLELADNDTLLSGLTLDNYDLVLMEHDNSRKTTPVNKNRPPIFSSKKIFSDDLLLVCSSGYYRRKINGKTEYRSLKNLEYLQAEFLSPLVDQWFRLNFKRTPENLHPVMWSNDLQVIANGVKSGMGLAVLPYQLVKKEVDSGTLSVISPHHRRLNWELVLVTIKNKKTSLTEQAFTSIMLKELEKVQAVRTSRDADEQHPGTETQ